MAVTFGREALLGDFSVDKTGLKATVKGPLWIDKYGEWLPRADKAFSDFAPWSAIEFIYKWRKQALFTDARHDSLFAKQDTLADAMIDAAASGTNAGGLAFAERTTLKFEWSGAAMVITIRGTTPASNPANLKFCKPENTSDPSICWGFGFDWADYDKDWEQGRRLASPCDKHCSHHHDKTFEHDSVGESKRPMLPAIIDHPEQVQSRSEWHFPAMKVVAVTLLSLALVLYKRSRWQTSGQQK